VADIFYLLNIVALLEHQSDEKIKGYLKAVEDAIAQLTNKRLQQLVLIKTSERYLDRHVASLEMLNKHMDKCEREIKTLEDKNMDLIDATSRLHPQIEALVATTKKLKREVRASYCVFLFAVLRVYGCVENFAVGSGAAAVVQGV
jgi:hypothetical protein